MKKIPLTYFKSSRREKLKERFKGENHLWRRLVQAGDRSQVSSLARLARLTRVLILAGVSFAVNEIPVRAAALTFTTILAFIPFAVTLSWVAGKLGYLDIVSKLVPYLASSFNLNLSVEPILNSLKTAQRLGFESQGWLGTMGLLLGFFLSMGNVESAMDKVWNLRRTRGWWARFKVYTPFLLILLILVLLSARILLSARDTLSGWNFSGAFPAFLPSSGVFLFGALGVLLFLWIGMALLIRVMPNTRVFAKPAWLGATVAAVLIYLFSRILFLFPKLLLEQNRFLYGSLAIIPVALLLIYVFWAAVLFGSAVAFIDQRLHREGSGQKRDDETTLMSGFTESMRGVMALWDAISSHQNASGQPLVVPIEVLAAKLHITPKRALELALPLFELKWIHRRGSGVRTYVRARVGVDEIDLMELHALMSRLDPNGAGVIEPQSAWNEALYAVKVLYSKRRDFPGIPLNLVRHPERNL